ncbi:synaptotagmin-like protein 3 isoform X1 [Oncorhynchus kisutch]|uniref:Synaptotagmin like 3 n=2 Tax=Oncorhynchus kisutch TaxID=8019 RepID=A0A8C7M610_ONCKI|nr:synaptotagmin-like protein 3 isoform X1 [Oncorhynchus kisutch]XP_020351842.1 synaptotagmin-like protein 3 isoform X1 [Oncorhynchus kisutch]XP_031692821.1 synaptotagmin-like protein 3 isoform X1 [Oncorhynchus kisutch]XP_031692822.1 synaptotagmin-like protein 3 isoform X1 [Oncorhynchus kisutch]
MDLGVLKALEREKVLEVLQRDKLLRSTDDDRIRRLKTELQEIRRKGAKSFARQYSKRTCARCQRPLGMFWNSGAVCRGCSHRVCNKCRVGVSALDWKCTVCHAYRKVKIRSGEWFLEERDKKFPPDSERHETVGEKLLKSYQRLSHITVVPPTAPPYYDGPSFSRSGGLNNSFKKPFTKSMEDLMVSLTSHMRRFSRSQQDVRVEQDLLTVDNRRGQSTGWKSLSDTNINKYNNLTKGPSLTNLFKKSRNDDQSSSSSGADEDLSLGSEYSWGKRGSSASSTGTDCGLLEINRVTGELKLAIAFNHITSCLEITINGCRNLAYGDIKRKKCHPYVKIFLLPEKSQSSKLKTTIKRNTTDPIYNEILQCQMESPLLSRSTLQVSVWHSATLKKKVFLGEVLVPLEGCIFKDSTTQGSNWYPLCPKPESPEGNAVEQDTAGELLVRMKFTSLSQPSWVCHTDAVHIGPHDVGQLTVLVTGAKNLPTKANNSQNTYVKGCLTLHGPRELVQRTPVLKKPSPAWSHQLLFSRVTPYDLQICTLELDLWDHAPFTFSDRLLGWVRMEAGSSWQLVLQTPNMWHDFSLPMQANINSRRT